MDQLVQIQQHSCEDFINDPRKAFMRVWIVYFFFLYIADRLGKFIVAGGAAVGLGALCYYGMGMSSEIGAIERAV